MHVASGEVLEVTATGDAEIYQLDPERVHRLLQPYLGPDDSRWPQRFKRGSFDDPATRLIRLEPTRLRARDLSYELR